VQELVMSLEDGGFAHLETFETLKRGWHVTERSVRPDHRMVGHTGFVTIARRVGRSD
jgi:tRNA (adenine57-N1/adenine58-N1)-methyltransferase